MGSPASHGGPQPPQGWQDSPGIGGSFAVEYAIIVLKQLQPLTRWLVSIPISRQRLNTATHMPIRAHC
jgi:hypothetical protein